MESKRIKLDNEDEDSQGSNSLSSHSSEERGASSTAATSFDQLKSANPSEVEKDMKRLKAALRSKSAVQDFVKQHPENFSVVVNVFLKAVSNNVGKGPPWPSILKDSISVIANCCNYSVNACVKMTSSKISLSHAAVRIFENTSIKQDCKTSMARLIANMCTHRESANYIASNASLVDRLVLLLESEDDATATQALRAVRGLVGNSNVKVVLLSNAGFYLGKMLISGKNTAAVVGVLSDLARRRVRDTGRQLAGSECSERLLELFFSDEVRGAKELVLMLCEGSTDIRDRMGDAHVIQKVVESADDSVMNCKLLASFAQEAWGRADLRESGALDFLVSHLAATPFNSADRQAVVQPLRHFVHDTNGMAHLVRNRLFVSTVVRDVQEFLAENQVICKPEIVKEEDFIFRPDSPLLMEIESELQRKEGDDSALLHKDYSALWSYSTYSSPSLTRWSSHSSPTYSPPSSGPASPVCSSSASPWTSPHSSNSRLSDLGGEASEGETSRAASCVDTVRADNVAVERVIESELWLLTWQAQEDTNLPYLGTEDVVNAVLSYLALAPAPDYRIGRVLRRLASSRHSIDSLLTIQFHTRVLHTLCTSPCRVVRYAKRCGRCERAADFGREMLREFASHVDSDFGNSFLIKRLTSDDFNTRVVAAIAKVALIRDRFRLGRMSSGRLPALDLLFDSIRTLLLREDFEEIAYETTYVDGPPICAQMVGAISTLISSKRLREILEVDSAVRPQERGECLIEKNSETPDVSVEMLVFETKDGEVLARVPMAAACKNSRYFEGMFNSDLLEKSSGRRTFVFCPNEEGCSAEDFTRFLHYLAGCRSHCTTISSPVAGVALVTLSDRYLCNSLSDFICSPHGPVRRILTGETLGTFLPAVLSTQTHDRLVAMCLLILVRYCSSSLIVSALRSICHSQLLVDAFTEQLRALISV